ncbi:NnrS family protein [Maricaulis sp.]|uniref:NnrS family protein n=1 Tax=Maricaulis sp. TaxID=1486257 RepID=UPI003A8C9A5C
MSDGVDRGAQRRRSWPVFQNAFRPFFLGGAAWAGLLVPLWLVEYLGLPLPFAGSGVSGHAHEMVFGFLSAIVCGFALTAIPNWTGRAPVAGWRLALLFGLWGLGRITGLMLPGPVATLIDAAFLIVLAAVVFREIGAGRNWRNLPVAGLIAIYALAHVAYHWSPTGTQAIKGALAVACILIALIGGRIVPSFTRNWLAGRDNEAASRVVPPMMAYDKLSIGLLAVALVAWVLWPAHLLTGGLLLLAGIIHCYRLLRWQGGATLLEPLMWSLHLGYAWLPAGLVMLGAGVIGPTFISASAGLHAISAGLIGSMTLAVMTRASLGHTGRQRRANTATLWIYGLVHLGAVLRVAAALMANDPVLLATGAILWSAAFLLFVLAYAPMMFGARPVKT